MYSSNGSPSTGRISTFMKDKYEEIADLLNSHKNRNQYSTDSYQIKDYQCDTLIRVSHELIVINRNEQIEVLKYNNL